jgi:hypothetical protein
MLMVPQGVSREMRNKGAPAVDGVSVGKPGDGLRASTERDATALPTAPVLACRQGGPHQVRAGLDLSPADPVELPVAASDDDLDALFGSAQAAEDVGNIEAVERLYRRLMKVDPADPAVPFKMAATMLGSGASE